MPALCAAAKRAGPLDLLGPMASVRMATGIRLAGCTRMRAIALASMMLLQGPAVNVLTRKYVPRP